MTGLYVIFVFGSLLRYAVLTGQDMGRDRADRIYAYVRVGAAAFFALFLVSLAMDITGQARQAPPCTQPTGYVP